MGSRRNIDGIEGLYYIWNGEWADPQYEYKGLICSTDDFWDYISGGEDVPDDAQLDPDELMGYLKNFGQFTPDLMYVMIKKAVSVFAEQNKIWIGEFDDYMDAINEAVENIEYTYADNFEEVATKVVLNIGKDVLANCEDNLDNPFNDEVETESLQEEIETIEKLLSGINNNPSEFWQPAWDFYYSL